MPGPASSLLLAGRAREGTLLGASGSPLGRGVLSALYRQTRAAQRSKSPQSRCKGPLATGRPLLTFPGDVERLGSVGRDVLNFLYSKASKNLTLCHQ